MIKKALYVLTLIVIGSAAHAIDRERLDALLEAAAETRSSGVVIMQHGEIVAEWYGEDDPGLIQTMSVTKSVVAMGVARLLTTGELESLDTPVAEFFPEWRQGRKRDITVRHLLNHTSGLQNHPNAGEEIYPSPDFVQLALAAELEDEPGERQAYNNKATNLIAGLFPKIVGKPMDEYIAGEIFAPLGITRWEWMRDEAGNPHGMAGLELHPRDLARLGQLMLDGGRYGDDVILSAESVEMLVSSDPEHNPTMGLLWWLEPAETRWIVDQAQLEQLRGAGVDPDFIERVAGARGEYDDLEAYYAALAQALGEDWAEQLQGHLAPRRLTLSRRETSEEIVAWYGDGYLGQSVVVVPESGIVAARMIGGFEGIGQEHSFADFKTRVIELAGD